MSNDGTIQMTANTLNIPDKVLKLLKCCCSATSFILNSKDTQYVDTQQQQQTTSTISEHIVKDAILLKCGGNICNKCIQELNRLSLDTFKCKYCSRLHYLNELKQMPFNQNINILIETFSKDLMYMLKHDFELTCKLVEDNASYEERLNNQLDYIQDKVNAKIDSIKFKLDQMALDFINDINKIRQSWKNLFPLIQIDYIKEKLETQTMSIHELQEKSIDIKQQISECFNKLNKIKFTQNSSDTLSTSDLSKTLIGHLEYPLYFNYRQMRTRKTIKLNLGENLERCALVNDEIFLTDRLQKRVKVISKNGDILGSYNPKGILAGPLAITSFLAQNQSFIIIGDCIRHELLIFDLNLTLVKRFSHKYLAKAPNSMCIDYASPPLATLTPLTSHSSMQTNQISSAATLYVTDWSFNSLYAYSFDSAQLINKIQIDSPSHVKLLNDKLYVISGIECELVPSKRKLSKITKGSNCIYEIDKQTLQILNTIKSDKWLSPCGLDINPLTLNIYTMAYYLDNEMNISEYFSLFIINSSGQCMHQLLLNGIQIVRDFVFLDTNYQRLIVCGENEIKFIEFE